VDCQSFEWMVVPLTIAASGITLALLAKWSR
jgi:hypothetical protein